MFGLGSLEDAERFDYGIINADNTVLGTYLHGLFDSPEMLSHWLRWAGLGQVDEFDYPKFREAQIERLADEVEQCMPLDMLLKLLSQDEAR